MEKRYHTLVQNLLTNDVFYLQDEVDKSEIKYKVISHPKCINGIWEVRCIDFRTGYDEVLKENPKYPRGVMTEKLQSNWKQI